MKGFSEQLGGLAQLATALGGEVTRVVQEMHGAIARPLTPGDRARAAALELVAGRYLLEEDIELAVSSAVANYDEATRR